MKPEITNEEGADLQKRNENTDHKMKCKIPLGFHLVSHDTHEQTLRLLMCIALARGGQLVF